MMKATFLAHSGFLIELDTACLLFDWWKGKMPPLPDKPLYVFASHRHPDHFVPRIFTLDDGGRDVRFFLSRDIELTDQNRGKWGLSDATLEKCTLLGGGEEIALPAGGTVRTLPSTDEGVAFLVTRDGKTVYHAGDLNWWHWEGEEKSWNRNMEVLFKRYLEPLRGVTIDLAMAPLDSRLEKAEDWGFLYLLELADIRRIFPMHQWKDYEPTDRFLAAHPDRAAQLVPVRAEGESWLFPD